MQWIKSGIENPSKSEVIGCCEKTNDHAEPTKSSAKRKIDVVKASPPPPPLRDLNE